jgi:alpha-D-xyloside xylohydrolase
MPDDTGAVTARSESSGPSVAAWESPFPGIWKASLGAAERFTPVKMRFNEPVPAALKLPEVSACPLAAASVSGQATARGYLVKLPLGANELVYGLGLQLHSFIQRGTKKTVRTNADPKSDTGDTHAPVPFYVTTAGYGVLIDTARYASFYLGRMSREDATQRRTPAAGPPGVSPDSLPRDYIKQGFDRPSEVMVEIPWAAGVDVYVFGGPTIREAVQRYNLFSGGGCLPPRWGLGCWYRCKASFDQSQVQDLAAEFRSSDIPCDVLGLEPGWQTHAYASSFVWGAGFRDPAALTGSLAAQGFRLNLWEHAFTHESSPIHAELAPYSGDFEVFGGLTPDFLAPRARQIFADFQEREHVDKGVSGYKLDECDNSDFTGGWSFPECSHFPSGVDGEQMHSFFGISYQETIEAIFRRRNLRTYNQVRSSNALAAPFPYVLYSDLYDHRQFIRGVVNCGFSGLLWCPEVRHAENEEDLIRRLQSVCLSPMALINAWYLKNPPWKQVESDANNADRFAPGRQDLEAKCREILRLRMRLIPYLYSAFVAYHEQGVPPFRALVMDYPADPRVWDVDDQFMMGERLLVAPLVAGTSRRSIYLPKGSWFDFWTGKSYSGEQKVTLDVPLTVIPIFVQHGTLLPLADPAPPTGHPAARKLTVRVYGDGTLPCTIYEDEDTSRDALSGKYNRVTLSWDRRSERGRVERTGDGKYPQYEVTGWEQVKGSVP